VRRRKSKLNKALGLTVKVIAGLVLIGLLWLGSLAFPQPAFRHYYAYGGYRVWSDRPIDPSINKVLDDATRRLKTSTLYEPDKPIRIFFCNDSWRLWWWGQSFGSKMAGATDTWLTRNIYLREADIPGNRILRTGNTHPMLDQAQRPLSYYIAHEATHALESRAFGRLMSVTYPQWLKEGYADYVGKAGDFDLDENRRLFVAGDRLLDFRATGLYRRFHLETAWLLDRKHQDIRQIFAHPPQQATVDAELKMPDGL
jgi:hypothetical protein